MTQKSTLLHVFSSRRAVLSAFVIFVIALATMALLTMAFGVHPSGPSYDLIADPGVGLPF